MSKVDIQSAAPTPYMVRFTQSNVIAIYDARGQRVAEMVGSFDTDKQPYAIAQDWSRKLNAFDALVEACRESLEDHKTIHGSELAECFCETCEGLRNVLRLAGEDV